MVSSLNFPHVEGELHIKLMQLLSVYFYDGSDFGQ
jgi:hypothetical protein